MLLPTNNDDISDFELMEQPSNTYRLIYSKDRLKGFTDDIEALKQTIYFILNTERYDYLIYDWDYGFQIKDLIGQNPKDILQTIQMRISDALIQDTRITEVSNFAFDINKNKVKITFTVKSIFGNIEQELIIWKPQTWRALNVI